MRGTVTGQPYVDDILRPHVGPFLNGLPGAIFQQDNARPHTARVAEDFLRHFQISMAGPLPRFVPCTARVGSAKMADAIVLLCTSFRVGCSRFVGPSASRQHKVSNQLNAGPCGGMYCN
ncbi:DDE_3 domain-containing protein [Trichonephila clavipes]|nr:DDE_3 domain-containing protein [Trichonephila clavipes]